MQKLREMFFRYAFLDINNSGKVKETYFVKFEDQISMDNQEMVSLLSTILAMVSFCIILVLTQFFPSSVKYVFHLMMLMFLLVFLFISKYMTFQYPPAAASYTMTVIFINFLFSITILNQIFHFDLPNVLFYIVMALAPIALIIPPLFSMLINLFWSCLYLIIVRGQLTDLLFYEEIMACAIVLSISSILSYQIGKTRAQQAFETLKTRQLTKTLQRTSVTDQLTGLLNHRSFQKDYYELFEACQSSGSYIGVIMVDIDKFKLFNDYYGHLEGDRCLSLIGKAIGEYTTEDISTYRFGGEEFVVLLWGTSASRTIALAESLCDKVHDLGIVHEYNPNAPVVTVSVGVHLGKPKKDEKPMNFFDRADQAMYQSKRNGGNKTTVFTKELGSN